MSEQEEMAMCLNANASIGWKLAELENLSLLASMTNDLEWQHEICNDIEQLEKYGEIKRTPKKDADK